MNSMIEIGTHCEAARDHVPLWDVIGGVDCTVNAEAYLLGRVNDVGNTEWDVQGQVVPGVSYPVTLQKGALLTTMGSQVYDYPPGSGTKYCIVRGQGLIHITRKAAEAIDVRHPAVTHLVLRVRSAARDSLSETASPAAQKQELVTARK